MDNPVVSLLCGIVFIVAAGLVYAATCALFGAVKDGASEQHL